MNKRGKRLLAILLVLLAVSATAVAYANSAAPPSLILIIDRAPEDVAVEAISPDNWDGSGKKVVAWETYFAFYDLSFSRWEAAEFRVTGAGKTFDIRVEGTGERGYDNIYTVGFDDQTVTPGKLPLRTALLVILRVAMTLIVEGAVFALFRFRQKRSWILFLIINLVTQGILYVSLSGVNPFMSYPILGLIFGEFFVFLAEMIAFPILIREHGAWRRVAYALLANAASLAIGWYTFLVLPI